MTGASTEPPRGGRRLGQQSVRGGSGMSHDEVKARKTRAERGWLADPSPPPPSPQPHDRADKWRRMYGQMPPENPEGFR